MKRILRLDHYEVKRARLHDAIRNLPIIGRGVFAAVFDNGDTVLKLTADPIGYAFHADGCFALKGKHFPKLVKDYECIGMQGELELHLVEIEKLEKIATGTEQRKTALKIGRKLRHGVYRLNFGHDWQKHLEHLSWDTDFERSMRRDFKELAGFFGGFPEATLDMHGANFMVRPKTGELVFSDPVADGETLSAQFKLWYRKELK